MKKIVNRNPKNTSLEFDEKKEYKVVKFLAGIFAAFLIVLLFNIFSIPIFIVWGIFLKNRYDIKKERENFAEIIWTTPPDDLRSAEIRFLYDGTHSRREIVSILFFLIRENLVSIEVLKDKEKLSKGSYILTRKYDSSIVLRKYEQMFLDFVFQEGDQIYWEEFLKNKYVDVYLSKISMGVQQELQRMEYYNFGEGFSELDYDEALAGAMKKFNLFLFIKDLGKGMVKCRTKKGSALMAHVVGFKKYLESSEKERVIFHADPEKMEIHIGEMMPYAVALDVYKEWQSELLGATFESGSVDGNDHAREVRIFGKKIK